ncbi:NAD(P)-dependent oxidoreductase [Arenivirga flava]|uniref:Phosphoglycerate dehydrogenase n=1 Tax=Arenivirga flava TaxID=1930060 RepID=A0AA37XAD1_9MICO|nr:NAD(P)-dependent oxidoreductase [Arenivirga flava]GMA29729.1 phosphoglycerate dehydrogenase [Arenivirga flava]
MTKILIPSDFELHLEPVQGVDVVAIDKTAPLPSEHADAAGFVEWAMSGKQVAALVEALPDLRWVQSLAAGPNTVLDATPSDVTVTGGSGLHDKPVAEHALALVLAGLRRVHLAVRAQQESRWAFEIGGPQPEWDPTAATTLRGARVTIWGYGNIARELAPHLVALGASVTGVARSARQEGDVRVVDDIDAVLPETDVLVMILPGSDATEHALDHDRLAALPTRSWVVNVGRGTSIDQVALLAALRSGAIRGAALDVTDPEPLPADSPLWGEPNLIITPHAAGGRPLGASELVQRNIEAFATGGELENVIAR